MKIITFHDRYPFPQTVNIGLSGDQNVEVVKIDVPFMARDQRNYVYMKVPTGDGIRPDVVELFDKQLMITPDIAARGGDIVCYAEVQTDDGGVLWHSSMFTMQVRDLLDVGNFERTYPGAIQTALQQTANDRAAAADSADQARKSAEEAGQRAGDADASAVAAAASAEEAAASAEAARLSQEAIEGAEDVAVNAAGRAEQADQNAAASASAASASESNAAASKAAAQLAQSAAEAAKAAADVSAVAAGQSATNAAQSAQQAASTAESVAQATTDGVQAIQAQQAASEIAITGKTDEQMQRIPEVTALAGDVSELKNDN